MCRTWWATWLEWLQGQLYWLQWQQWQQWPVETTLNPNENDEVSDIAALLEELRIAARVCAMKKEKSQQNIDATTPMKPTTSVSPTLPQ